MNTIYQSMNHQYSNHRFKYFNLMALTVLLLLSCSTKEPVKEATEKPIEETVVSLNKEQLKNAALVMGNISTQNMQAVIQVNGVVDVPPQSLVSISFPLGGYLKNSHLLPGTSVRKGEVLAVMEDQSYVQLQQDFLVAKAKMEYLQVDVQRQKELSDADAASKKNYQLVLSEFKTQQIMIKALEEKLKIIGINPTNLTVANISRTVSIKSPIAGYVTHVNVNIGKYVNPSDVLFELVNPDDIHAAMTVFEKDFGFIKKGMKGTVTLADQPEKKYEVDVILATKNINENRAGLVHCHFENNNHDLLPGMFLTGEFKISNAQVKALPQDAVIRYEGKEYIFVTKDTATFEMLAIETGIKQSGFVEIKNKDLPEDKQVVIKNAYSLLGKLKNKMED
jgi:cobalt-zinc-cadmium efflux system membrane fusion protein